ncbi:hypothetical protein [Roseibium denhamense]|uniref:Uncharacterized protein n=1 Tax=Roseibium denhamense TaxID=76305 RepID=A0ABY1NTU2_9HYPH|nr:hypothetical protein [Roseibium denhamense]SMP17704.1 hypothetical protein SAMN06265374_1844 [Roseibium denhamense]
MAYTREKTLTQRMTTQISDQAVFAVLAMQSYDFLDEDQPSVSPDDLTKNFGLAG